MGQGQIRVMGDDSAMSDEVEIERPSGVSGAPHPAEFLFEHEQCLDKRFRGLASLDKHDTITILITIRVRPSGRAPPGGSTQDGQSRLRETRERSLEKGFGRAIVASHIAAQGDNSRSVRIY
jgi:hypothetical protein